jgi:hypothetical protein
MAWVFFIAAAIIVLAHTAPAPFLLEAVNPERSVWRVEPQPGDPPAIYLTTALTRHGRLRYWTRFAPPVRQRPSS